MVFIVDLNKFGTLNIEQYKLNIFQVAIIVSKFHSTLHYSSNKSFFYFKE